MQKYSYLSLGAGKQSSLLAIMIVNNDIRIKEHWGAEIIFSDTGAEEDYTYNYLNFLEIYCKDSMRKNPKQILKISRDISLYDYMFSRNQVMLGWVSPLCSSWSKRDNIRKYYRNTHGENGRLSSKKVKITELIGITTDEIGRAKISNVSWLERKYPFIELGLSRDDLDIIYSEYKIPSAKKSGCWFCPNKPLSHFFKLKKEYPHRFELLVKLEDNAKGNPPPTLKLDGRLTDLIGGQMTIDNFDWSDQQCDSGFCFT